MRNPLACTTGGYPGENLERVFRGLATSGFRYVELSASASPHSRISPEQLTAADLQRLRDQLAAFQLQPVSISGHANLARADGMAQFKARIDLAVALEVSIVNTGTGHTETAQDEDAFFAMATNDLIPYAAERRVHIALETHGGLTGTAADCLRTLERLDSPWVGINYDPANVLYYRGVRPEQDIVAVRDHIIHFHLKDQRGGRGVADFPPLGEGEIDFQALLSALV
jgi:sugar phosphate isomerase/epimerase